MSNTNENPQAFQGLEAAWQKTRRERAQKIGNAGYFLNNTFPRNFAEVIPEEQTVVMDRREWPGPDLLKVHEYCTANKLQFFITAVITSGPVKARLVIFSTN